MQENFETTFEKLFKKSYPMLFCYAQKIVGYDDAADVVEEVFFDVWKRKETINVINKRNPTHRYITLIEEMHQRQLDTLEDNHSKMVIEKIENHELGDIIKEKIDGLPEKCRESFRMSYIYNMRNEDIADVLGVSIRTVESHIYHALKILRNELKQLKK